jgi:hypothetical protein
MTLAIYDNTGYIYLQMSGAYIKPQGGIQYLEVDESTYPGKFIKSIDTSVTPNVPIFEDIPKTELQIAQEQIKTLQEYIIAKESSDTTVS